MPAFKKVKDTDEVLTLNMNKTMSVPDERLIKHLELKAEAEADAARDRTFEEFKEMYLDHIEGNVDPNIRLMNRPGTGDEEGIVPQEKSRGKTGMSH